MKQRLTYTKKYDGCGLAEVIKGIREEQFIEKFNNDEDCYNRARALAQHLDEKLDALEVSSYSDTTFEDGRAEYMVLTDDEADEKWDEYLENYIDECILYELPENLRFYFDREAWKSDARIDGRAHCLSIYDGNEWDEEVDGETFYIYRTN